jgi:hypothetical protein
MRALARAIGWGAGYLFLVLLERVITKLETTAGPDPEPEAVAA